MISLDIKSYCQECGNFEPEVVRCERTCLDDSDQKFNTVVYCRNQSRCAELMDYLKSVESSPKTISTYPLHGEIPFGINAKAIV